MASNDREIERKYLLRALPELADSVRSAEVDQGYLPGERINERIRRMRDASGTRYYRTLKSGSGLERSEIEEEVNEEFFVAVWPLTRGARVHKRRYFVPLPGGNGVWEIDEFLDRPDLVLAEFEMEDVGQVVEIPQWLAPVLVRDVTDEQGFTNHALAK